MPTVCPKCAASISLWKVKRSFKCPHCAVPLESNFFGIAIVSVVIWSVVEVGIKMAVRSWLGDNDSSSIIAIIFSGAFGFSLYYIAALLFTSIREASNSAIES